MPWLGRGKGRGELKLSAEQSNGRMSVVLSVGQKGPDFHDSADIAPRNCCQDTVTRSRAVDRLAETRSLDVVGTPENSFLRRGSVSS